MEQVETRQMSESFRLGAVLALAGGFLDAYTYLVRGGVFANAQTGNIVLLGVRLMEGDWAGAGHYLVPILAFAAGVLTAELVHARCGRWERLHWRQLTVAAEILLLAAVAFLPAAADGAANVLVSYVCAVQVQSFRKFHGRPRAAPASPACSPTTAWRASAGCTARPTPPPCAPATCAAAPRPSTAAGSPGSGNTSAGRGGITASSCSSAPGRPWGPGAAGRGAGARCWPPACCFLRHFC